MTQAELTGDPLLTSAADRPEARSRAKVPLAMVLVGGIVMLVVVAVGSALAISLRGAGENTFSLLRDRADIGLRLLETRIRSQLDPVALGAVSLAAKIESGELDPGEQRRLMAAFSGALSALPQVGAVSYRGLDGTLLQKVSDTNLLRDFRPRRMSITEIKERLERLERADGPVWLPPVWRAGIGQPILIVAAPVRQDGSLTGAIVMAIELGSLADFLAEIEVGGPRAFVLYNENQVLSHPDLVAAARRTGISDGEPLPRLADFDDPGLRLLRAEDRRAMEIESHRIIAYEGEEAFVLTRDLPGYGREPWVIGLTISDGDARAELRRLWMTVGAGLLILLLSIIAALAFGKHITRQIRGLTDAASRLEALDLSDAPTVPDSRIRELANAGAAFNAMTGALRQFENYVPKSLVLRLMRRGDAGTAVSQLRDITVMFTDIRGFSAMAERLSAEETAAFLNQHFSTLAACIEAEGGTVDKFVGDGIMAFWGAPDIMDDHAARALRAAAAIAMAVAADNTGRVARGEEKLHVRIGLHSGPAVVGNIGAETRVNYTVVGDTVNTAAHLQALGRTVDNGADCIVLYSATTNELADRSFPCDQIGAQQLKGRAGQVDVYRLKL